MRAWMKKDIEQKPVTNCDWLRTPNNIKRVKITFNAQ